MMMGHQHHQEEDKSIEPERSVADSVPALLGDGDDDDGGSTEQLPAFLESDGSTQYKYRDFGHVQEDAEDEVTNSEIPPPTPNNRGSSESSIRVQKFPVKLYAILAQKEFHDIICWMPHGRSWKVLKPSMFESLVMPLFFEYSNYHSFNRLVNAWSFRRLSSGPDRGSYYHELFLRGKPHLQRYMRRLPKTHKKLPMKKKDEPDFYALDKTSPLPQIEDAPIPGAAATIQAMNQNRPAQHLSPLPHSSPMHVGGPQGPSNSSLVTPHVSPNHQQAFIDAPHSSHIMPPSNRMMGHVDHMGNAGSMMHGGGMMGSPGMMNMGNMNMGMGMMGGGQMNGISRGFNPRFQSFDDGYGPDEYDMPPIVARHQSGMGQMGQFHPQIMSGSMNNPMNGGFAPFRGQPSGMRRTAPMRTGPSMDHMHEMGNGELYFNQPASMMPQMANPSHNVNGSGMLMRNGFMGTNKNSLQSDPSNSNHGADPNEYEIAQPGHGMQSRRIAKHM